MEINFVVAECNSACSDPNCELLHVSGWFADFYGPFGSKAEAEKCVEEVRESDERADNGRNTGGKSYR